MLSAFHQVETGKYDQTVNNKISIPAMTARFNNALIPDIVFLFPSPFVRAYLSRKMRHGENRLLGASEKC